jgi:hypothetical protein
VQALARPDLHKISIPRASVMHNWLLFSKHKVRESNNLKEVVEMNCFTKAALSSVVALTLLGGVAATSFAAGPNVTPTSATGVCPGGYGPFGGARAGYQITSSAVTDLLGMTQEQIQAERQSGKSLVQIAQAKGVEEAKLVEAILAAKKASLDQIVASGRITQAQADQMYQTMQTRVEAAVNRTEVGPMGAANRAGAGNGLSMRQSSAGQTSLGKGPGLANRWGNV